MTHYNYRLGDIVRIDPVGEGRGPKARIVGRIEWIDGSVGYFAAAQHFGNDGAKKHLVSEYEITRAEGGQ